MSLKSKNLEGILCLFCFFACCDSVILLLECNVIIMNFSAFSSSSDPDATLDRPHSVRG